jgi:hypothetical protein
MQKTSKLDVACSNSHFLMKKDGKMLYLWAMTGWTRPEVIP